MKIRNSSLTIVILLLASFVIKLNSQEWIVPDDKKVIVASFKFTEENTKNGETVYRKNCVSCHGDPGKKNWANIVPVPGDPASEKFQKLTDGEIFYMISTGKSPMPTFKDILSEDERWNLVSYIRSFHPNYVQPEPKEQVAFKGMKVSLALNYLKEQAKIRITALNEKDKTPAAGVEIRLFAKRYFGNLQLDESKTTNDKGEVFFDIPKDIPGDKTGNVEVLAKVSESDNLRANTAGAVLNIGLPVNAKSLIDTRDWWTTRDKAPVWLILIFSLTVIIVWGFIFHILSQVLKIRKLG